MGINNIDGDQFKWQSMAACRGVPSYIFFPEEQLNYGFKPDPKYIGITYETICGMCPVRGKCLDFALVHDLHGIWGGKTDKERNRMFIPDERKFMREERNYVPLYGHL